MEGNEMHRKRVDSISKEMKDSSEEDLVNVILGAINLLISRFPDSQVIPKIHDMLPKAHNQVPLQVKRPQLLTSNRFEALSDEDIADDSDDCRGAESEPSASIGSVKGKPPTLNTYNDHFPSLYTKRKRENRKIIQHSDKCQTDSSRNVAVQSGSNQNQYVPNTSNIITNTDSKAFNVPPIIIKYKHNWNSVSNEAKRLDISFKSAINCSDGIKIYPSTEDDFRKLVHALKSMKCEFHTYQLPADKPLRVVFRGVPEDFTIDEIKEELLSSGFHPSCVARMTHRVTKNPIPMILVQVPKTERNIYQVTTIKSISVKVESQHPKSRVTQCFRCQRFGHAQGNCTARPRCVKCAQEHFTFECPKQDKTTPATCANCGGAHPASYRACSATPKLKRNLTRQTNIQTTPPPPPSRPTAARTQQTTPNTPGTHSYARVTSAVSPAPQQMAGFCKFMETMQSMMSQWASLAAAFPRM